MASGHIIKERMQILLLLLPAGADEHVRLGRPMSPEDHRASNEEEATTRLSRARGAVAARRGAELSVPVRSRPGKRKPKTQKSRF